MGFVIGSAFQRNMILCFSMIHFLLYIQGIYQMFSKSEFTSLHRFQEYSNIQFNGNEANENIQIIEKH